MKYILILLASISSTLSFGQGSRSQALSELNQTDFVLTLEHEFSIKKNSIYCASFLYAWEGIRTHIKTPIQIDASFRDLLLVNNSRSHVNTLRRNEFTSVSEVRGSLIHLGSSFDIALPFEYVFMNNGLGVMFNEEKVDAFGNMGQKTNLVEVLFYENNADFIIKILTKDAQHEVILSVSPETFSSMQKIVSDIDRKIKTAKSEKSEGKNLWKYSVLDDDVISIPQIDFNLETSHQSLETKTFVSNAIDYKIDKARQQMAFHLNETGVKIDTRAFAEIVFAAPIIDGEEKRKLFVFDKPFFVMLKRADSPNPYFAMWVANTELMKKLR